MPSPTSSSPTGSGALTSRRPSARLDPDRHLALRAPRDRGDVAAHLDLAPGPRRSSAPASIAAIRAAPIPIPSPARRAPRDASQSGAAAPARPRRAARATSATAAARSAPAGRRSPPSGGEAASPSARPASATWRQGSPSAPLRLEPVAKRLHRRRADAADLVELVDRGEPAVLVAVGEDVARGHRPDALDRVELLERRRAEADRPVRRRRGRGARPCRPGPLRRDDDLLAVGELRREVDRVGEAARADPACALDRVGDPRRRPAARRRRDRGPRRRRGRPALPRPARSRTTARPRPGRRRRSSPRPDRPERSQRAPRSSRATAIAA